MKFFVFLLGFFALSTALIIKCDYKNQEFYGLGSVPSCIVMECDLDGNQSVSRVTKRKSPSKKFNKRFSSDDILGISFKNCPSLDFIPQNLLEHFPNFIAMEFLNNDFKTLLKDELNEYENLNSFRFIMQDVKHIPGDFFSQNPRLQFIDFAYNHIKSIGSDLLLSFYNLKQADFSHNICINENVERQVDMPNFIVKLWKNCVSDKDAADSIHVSVTATPNGELEHSEMIKNVAALSEDHTGINEKIQALAEKIDNFKGIIDSKIETTPEPEEKQPSTE